MPNKSFIDTKQLKILLYILFAVLMVTYLSGLVAKEFAHYQNNSAQRIIDESFNNIRVQLEQHGLNKNLDPLTKSYSKLFKDNCNVIVTDETGHVLYQLNDAYIPNFGTFHLLINPWKTTAYGADIAYVIDSANNLKYAAQAGSLFNPYELRANSLKNPLSKELYAQEGDLENTVSDKEIKNGDGSIYVANGETSLVFDYGYITSKKLHLFSIYDADSQSNNYFLKTEFLFAAKSLFHKSALIGLVMFWLLLPLWVYRDAAIRGKKSMPWVLLTLAFNVLGLMFYLMLAGPPKKTCATCNQALDKAWNYCPSCGEPLTLFEPSQKENTPDEPDEGRK